MDICSLISSSQNLVTCTERTLLFLAKLRSTDRGHKLIKKVCAKAIKPTRR